VGSIFKKTTTKLLPVGAKVRTRKGQLIAEWKDAKGKARTAPATIKEDGTYRVTLIVKTYTAKYRDGQGIVREVATGCRDASAARSILVGLEKRAEKVKSGIFTAAEDRAAEHQRSPTDER